MPTISSSLADLLYNVANVFVIAGAAAALFGALGTIWMGSVKERYSDQRMAANEAKIATANEIAAKANERAAGLEKDAAEARLEQERLKIRSLEFELQVARLGPRDLSSEQVKVIADRVSAAVVKPLIAINFSTNPEAVSYAEKIAKAFNQAGCHVERGYTAALGVTPGITVSDSSGVIQDALKGAGIKFRNASASTESSKSAITIGEKLLE